MVKNLSLAPDYKWARFFRLQMAVKQTAKNRQRLAAGKRQVGRPMPRLVSIDTEDLFQVLESWALEDAVSYAASCGTPYFAVFMDGKYMALSDVSKIIQACLDAGKIMVLPKEALSLW